MAIKTLTQSSMTVPLTLMNTVCRASTCIQTSTMISLLQAISILLYT